MYDLLVLTHSLRHSWKYWQELNLVVGPKIAIAKYWHSSLVRDCHMYIYMYIYYIQIINIGGF